ncbi:MAG: NUDIX hydrolase [Candidatus Omnitrophota bacterium]|nr:NUDIX hydrolase [Candidatus Omnitrophota bacterium]
MSGMKLLFNGRMIKLYSENRRLPNGVRIDLELIKHIGAVLIVPFLSRDKIVLIRQYRPVINSYIWELPAGNINANEKPLASAHRELAEEVGYRARTIKRSGYIYPSPGYCTEKIIIYEARGLTKIAARPEKDEIITAKVFSRKGVDHLLRAGRIVDSKTICGLKLAGVI